MKIYTKTGDGGQTGLFSGKRVSKASLQVDAYGEVDELNSWLGLVLTELKAAAFVSADIQTELTKIQHDLHRVGADLATSLESAAKIDRMTADRASDLEGLIDGFESELSPLTQFILPGGSGVAAHLHISRCVCRRAERAVVRLQENLAVNAEVIRYLNRLSDLLFVLARVANKRAQVTDIFWQKNS